MNSLETHIRSKNLNEVACMNDLQNAGVVSDNCVSASDVAEADCTTAIAFLTFRELNACRRARGPELGGNAQDTRSEFKSRGKRHEAEQKEMPFSRQPYLD